MEAVPAPHRQLPLEAAGLGQLQLAVDLDRMMDAGQHRQPHARQAQDAIAEALVVVDDVEVVGPPRQQATHAQAEGERLGEAGRAHDAELQGVDPVAVLPEAGKAEGILIPVEVEAGDPDQLDTRVELRVGLAAEDRDPVANSGEGSA